MLTVPAIADNPAIFACRDAGHEDVVDSDAQPGMFLEPCVGRDGNLASFPAAQDARWPLALGQCDTARLFAMPAHFAGFLPATSWAEMTSNCSINCRATPIISSSTLALASLTSSSKGSRC